MELIKTLIWIAGFAVAAWGGVVGLLTLPLNPPLGIFVLLIMFLIASRLS